MKIKTTIATIAAVLAGTFSATAMLMPAQALAYSSQSDCEASEGAGACSYCVLGQGDGGWHRSAACAGALAVHRNIGKRQQLFSNVKREERAAVKARIDDKRGPHRQ
jgi:hypothetical protein